MKQEIVQLEVYLSLVNYNVDWLVFKCTQGLLHLVKTFGSEWLVCGLDVNDLCAAVLCLVVAIVL